MAPHEEEEKEKSKLKFSVKSETRCLAYCLSYPVPALYTPCPLLLRTIEDDEHRDELLYGRIRRWD
jgi:hypothetical protein